MGKRLEIKLYFAYTSPFTYLAMGPAYALEESHRVRLRFIPFAVGIRRVYGDLPERTERAWRKVRYMYRDARRFANERGLIIRGPRKIYNARLASLGGLYADPRGKFRPYSDQVFERFFKRELDVEDQAGLEALMVEVGLDPIAFRRYIVADGPADLAASHAESDRDQIFGVPTFTVEGEPFWGNDRVEWVIKKLDRMGLRR